MPRRPARGSSANIIIIKRSVVDVSNLQRSEEPVVGRLEPQEPGDDAPPVTRHAEHDAVIAGRSDIQRCVHDNDVGRPEQRHAHLVGGLRRRVEDSIAGVPVGSPFLHQRRLVTFQRHVAYALD